MRKTDWVIKNNNGLFFREANFPNEKREDRWVKKLSDAMLKPTKKEAETIICLGYLRNTKAIRVSELTTPPTTTQ